MSITIYGIRNCDTMKKARGWLDGRGLDYHFHDYRADGLDADTLRRWESLAGWEKLLNRSSATYRALPEADKAELDAETAMHLMLGAPTMIKRPVLDVDGRITVGFKPEIYDKALG